MADNDVSPGILEQMNQSIEANNASKRARNRLIVKADKGQAGYEDAYNFAGLRGKAAADAIREIEETDLPNGRMYFNIADKSIRPVLQKTGEDIYSFSSKILEKINEKAGFHLKPVLPDPEVLEDKVKGILDLAASAEHWSEVREEVAQTTENFSKKCVDDHIQANAERQFQAGLSAKVVRTASHGACEWCSDIAGTYSYEAVRGKNEDVWRRHANCDCVVEYEPVKGKRQTVSSGKYRQNKDSLSPKERERRVEANTKTDRIRGKKAVPFSERGIEIEKRISDLLEVLEKPGSYVEVESGYIDTYDLAVMTTEKGVEFALLEINNNQYVIRGLERQTEFAEVLIKRIKDNHGILKAHSHPFIGDLSPSLADMETLNEIFPWQESSLIVDPEGRVMEFTKLGIVGERIPDRRKIDFSKIFGGSDYGEN